MVNDTNDDPRFTNALYPVSQVAAWLRINERTFRGWTHGDLPLVFTLPQSTRHEATVPFIGLAEAITAADLRSRGFSTRKIRAAMQKVEEDIGLIHALASRRLYTHGTEVLFDYEEKEDGFRHLAEVLKQNYVFPEVVSGALKLLTFGNEFDEYATRLVLPLAEREIVAVEPGVAFGQPTFIHGGARLQDVLSRIRAREPIPDVAADFGVSEDDVLDILRGFIPQAA